MASISFLIDEDTDARIAEVLRARGHGVEFSRAVVGEAAADTLVAAAAERLSVIEADRRGAIVITRNCRHFRRLIRRETAGARTPYPHAGLICLQCRPSSELQRMQALIEVIEAEYTVAQRQADSRVIIEIGEAVLRILR